MNDHLKSYVLCTIHDFLTIYLTLKLICWKEGKLLIMQASN